MLQPAKQTIFTEVIASTKLSTKFKRINWVRNMWLEVWMTISTEQQNRVDWVEKTGTTFLPKKRKIKRKTSRPSRSHFLSVYIFDIKRRKIFLTDGSRSNPCCHSFLAFLANFFGFVAFNDCFLLQTWPGNQTHCLKKCGVQELQGKLWRGHFCCC